MSATCGICSVGPRKYKCPLCRLPYCSTVCYKVHKEVPCSAPAPAEPTEPSAPPTTVATTSSTGQPSTEEDEVPLLTNEQLAVLSMSANLKKALHDPATRSKITAVRPPFHHPSPTLVDRSLYMCWMQIDAHPDRLQELQKALTDPVFARFVYNMMDEVRA
ncbi:hypothetical protein AaE_011382 [Aphanomyces astaci]|uniref:HIT-type domain-containing protein n=1 Tax=Aphanomyces astaci TaxID=112090 RepID=A0A6A4ZX70_APHAT|nr:hypothetical protein AaE_011382 [Aphanomyces astaci]